MIDPATLAQGALVAVLICGSLGLCVIIVTWVNVAASDVWGETWGDLIAVGVAVLCVVLWSGIVRALVGQ